MATNWLCPLCEWSLAPAKGGLDYGLMIAHLRLAHEEPDLIPHELLVRSPRRWWQCACGWRLAWDFNNTPVGPRFEEDPGLMIAKHVDLMHPEMIHGSLIPIAVVQRNQEVLR